MTSRSISRPSILLYQSSFHTLQKLQPDIEKNKSEGKKWRGDREGVGHCQNNHLSNLATRRVSYGAISGGLHPKFQAQWENVKLFWNNIEFENVEISTRLLEKKLDKIEEKLIDTIFFNKKKQQLQVTINASNQINVIQNRSVNMARNVDMIRRSIRRHQKGVKQEVRVSIPDYNEETNEASNSDASIPELSSQEIN
ncbi:18409_t:CDS:2 [Acaulospora morrowiae]|uniref:18409_t:CDS:1 n=1 Tax=Acaulospora morrowiae TaxID=94023 RepID=A0A9N9GFN1_9GLOM|nr:18409_t:CDS:2 [Acaulospora morrowiae]